MKKTSFKSLLLKKSKTQKKIYASHAKLERLINLTKAKLIPLQERLVILERQDNNLRIKHNKEILALDQELVAVGTQEGMGVMDIVKACS